METLKQRLARKGLLVSDGAWGTMLQAAGLPAGHCPELWNIENSGAPRGVAAAYAAAGADLVLANTFGGNRLKLAKFGLESRVAELNRAGMRLSLEAAHAATPEPALAAASLGPTGEFLEPYGDLSVEEMEGIFEEQIAAFAEGGARIVCIETMTAVEEACCAVRAARRVRPDMEVIATLTFDLGPAGYKTMMGVDIARAAGELEEAGADVVGANCGNGMPHMVEIAREFARQTQRPVLIHANAGVPELVCGKTVFRETPEAMTARVPDLVEAGARIIGGCCGTTPAHIAAMRAAVESLRPGKTG